MNKDKKWSWWKEFAFGEISLPSSLIIGLQSLLFVHGPIADELTRPFVSLTIVVLVALINVRFAQLCRDLEILRSEKSSATMKQ